MYLNIFILSVLFAFVLSDNPPPQSSKPRIPEKSANQNNNNAAQTTTTTEDPNSGNNRDKGKRARKGGCFHGNDFVITDKGRMMMSELATHKDISVLTKAADGKLEFSSVYYWIHAQPDIYIEYITFTTESGHSLPITGKHLIYQSDCNGNSETIFADKVSVGKCLFVNQNDAIVESKVVTKLKEQKKGVYAPITVNGNIIVNNVLASCFTNIENEAIQRIIYSYMNFGHSILKFILPNSFVDLLYSNQKSDIVLIPEIILSFLDLSKGFFK